MELLVEVGDPCRFRTEAQFARWRGAAPLAVSSGGGTVGHVATGSTSAATARSTRCCTSCTSRKSAVTSPLAPSWPERSVRTCPNGPRTECTSANSPT
ncbi:transposase [Streptomyces sp. NPDC055966]|uniref:transposase n=1 Tax=Streptomyces sp. NPDC055966 TaxID=3345669 RepID=UPI0035D76E17